MRSPIGDHTGPMPWFTSPRSATSSRSLAPSASTSRSSPGPSSPPSYANVVPSGDQVMCAASTEPSCASSPVDTVYTVTGVDNVGADRFGPMSPAIASWSVPGRHSRSLGRRSGRRRISLGLRCRPPTLRRCRRVRPTVRRVPRSHTGDLGSRRGPRSRRGRSPSGRQRRRRVRSARSRGRWSTTAASSAGTVKRPNSSRAPSGDHAGHASTPVSDPGISSRRATPPGRTR